ncbi:MAG TPA: RNA polymerase sigma factor SigJ [Leptospiraceae bacterium]|nr:RNA polymerase sigma factor SigJ [Leptospiraceae bacterium]HNJ35448.1 RNA polymerase sigma factor SigJ [Leptospiraceae bacterium]
MTHTSLYTEHRRLLFSIAYRMTGSSSDAQDILQEGYLKFQNVALNAVNNSRAFLITLITRMCIDFLDSAYERRRTYIGPWLPEPITESPEEDYVRMESLSTAFLLMLERLSPVERAVFLLRDVFDVDYAEIASMLEKSEENCRQISSRARKHVSSEAIRFETPPQKKDQLFRAFLRAVQKGDVHSLGKLLCEDARMISDGGGKVNAARNVVSGAAKCIRGILGVAKKQPPDAWPVLVEGGGEPALVLLTGGKVYTILNLSYRNGQIDAVYSILNPDKLQNVKVPPLARVASIVFSYGLIPFRTVFGLVARALSRAK